MNFLAYINKRKGFVITIIIILSVSIFLITNYETVYQHLTGQTPFGVINSFFNKQIQGDIDKNILFDYIDFNILYGKLQENPKNVIKLWKSMGIILPGFKSTDSILKWETEDPNFKLVMVAGYLKHEHTGVRLLIFKKEGQQYILKAYTDNTLLGIGPSVPTLSIDKSNKNKLIYSARAFEGGNSGDFQLKIKHSNNYALQTYEFQNGIITLKSEKSWTEFDKN